ncbi:hypothetical protein QAD02_002693 [Eretmocerus hayati]|uniref:Uncharacterized protein n=1 Tax=Eretmocerus hayati TaxID=131215 RepID=A0ACC2NM94_9HYME|nr:hypothetical protein QAD02_002693 [Eretmocerus hayati]
MADNNEQQSKDSPENDSKELSERQRHTDGQIDEQDSERQDELFETYQVTEDPENGEVTMASAAQILAGLSNPKTNQVDSTQDLIGQNNNTSVVTPGISTSQANGYSLMVTGAAAPTIFDPTAPGVYTTAPIALPGSAAPRMMSVGASTYTTGSIRGLPPPFTKPSPLNYRFGPPNYEDLTPNLRTASEMGPNFMLENVDKGSPSD